MFKFPQRILAVLGLILAFSSLASAQHTEQRSAYTIRQTSPVTCGPAALATLLTYFAGVPTTEETAVKAAEPFATRRGQPNQEEVGFSALSLKKAGQELGLKLTGHQVSSATLQNHFSKGGWPLIAHLQKPEPHFVVLVGIQGKYLVISDPSWGRKLEPMELYLRDKAFSGSVLAPHPVGKQMDAMRKAQGDNLRWASQQLARLGIR